MNLQFICQLVHPDFVLKRLDVLRRLVGTKKPEVIVDQLSFSIKQEEKQDNNFSI